MSKRRPRATSCQQSAIRHGGGSSVGLSYDSVSQPMQPEHIPTTLRLERRPTRDDREEELHQLRTEDGRILALVERVDPASLPN